jgi:hypothetical protein
MAMGRGRKSKFQLVFNTLEEAVIADCPPSAHVFRVELLGQTRFVLTSSPTNAVRMAAYSLGATAKNVPVRDAVAAALKSAGVTHD